MLWVTFLSQNIANLGPTNGCDRFGSLGHPSKFQRVSRLAFVTAATSLTHPRPILGWYIIHTRPIHFGGSCPLTELCPVQYSLYVQVLRSSILAALLHGIPAAGVSQTLRRGTRNGITELSHRAPPIFGRVVITLGEHSSVVMSF